MIGKFLRPGADYVSFGKKSGRYRTGLVVRCIGLKTLLHSRAESGPRVQIALFL
jgi:hypothetical protein